jgi:hypothetical protein
VYWFKVLNVVLAGGKLPPEYGSNGLSTRHLLPESVGCVLARTILWENTPESASALFMCGISIYSLSPMRIGIIERITATPRESRSNFD